MLWSELGTFCQIWCPDDERCRVAVAYVSSSNSLGAIFGQGRSDFFESTAIFVVYFYRILPRSHSG